MKTKHLLALIILFIIPFAVKADNGEPQVRDFEIDQDTVSRGYTINLDGDFKLGLNPKVLTKPAKVAVKRYKSYLASSNVFTFGEVAGQLNLDLKELKVLPGDKKAVSDVFEFEISDKKNYSGQPINLEIKYAEDGDRLKEIYLWDKGAGEWQRLPSKLDLESGSVKAAIHLPYAKVAVLKDFSFMCLGKASWYKYKDCSCAASPDFPKKTLLRVTNLDNDKSAVVKINDWGPERDKHPDRVIDLDKTVFQKLASLRSGLINVKVEPL